MLNGANGVLSQGGNAFVFLKESTVMSNVTGLSTVSGGSILSYQNNGLTGNVTDGAPTAKLRSAASNDRLMPSDIDRCGLPSVRSVTFVFVRSARRLHRQHRNVSLVFELRRGRTTSALALARLWHRRRNSLSVSLNSI
jgi:hypothetical protein